MYIFIESLQVNHKQVNTPIKKTEHLDNVDDYSVEEIKVDHITFYDTLKDETKVIMMEADKEEFLKRIYAKCKHDHRD